MAKPPNAAALICLVIAFALSLAGGASAKGGDAQAGKAAFEQCAACHSPDPGVTIVGPSLHGVVGSPTASVNGFSYSDALQNLHTVWTVDKLQAFLADPQGFAPGTYMGFPGVKDAKARADLIAYLATLK